MLVDVHQHLWSTQFVEALESRAALPYVRRTADAVTLHLAGERPYVIDLVGEDPAQRARVVARDGLDHALIAISSPLGVEALPRAQASVLIDAYVDGVCRLPPEFSAWGPVALESRNPGDVDDLLDRGFVGVSLPAGALAEPDSWLELEGLLARLQARHAPLFVHPGPGLLTRAASSPDEPAWWRALTGYVSQMQAAWLAFVCRFKPEVPDLRVVFAMLAGGAPLLSERLEGRGGPKVDLRDRLLWYDCSSYGAAAVDAMADRVGVGQLLYGSDRPVAQPTPTGRDELLRANGAWLLDRVEPPA